MCIQWVNDKLIRDWKDSAIPIQEALLGMLSKVVLSVGCTFLYIDSCCINILNNHEDVKSMASEFHIRNFNLDDGCSLQGVDAVYSEY